MCVKWNDQFPKINDCNKLFNISMFFHVCSFLLELIINSFPCASLTHLCVVCVCVWENVSVTRSRALIQIWVQDSLTNNNSLTGRQGGSVGRASVLRSKEWRFEPRLHLEHKKNLWELLLSQKYCADSVLVCPTPMYENNHVHTLKICSPRQSSVDHGNTKRPSMHFN